MTYRLQLPKYKNVAIKLDGDVLCYFNVFGRYVDKELSKVKSFDNFINLQYDGKDYTIKPYIEHILKVSDKKEYENETDLNRVKLLKIIHTVTMDLESEVSFDDFKDRVSSKVEDESKDEDLYADLDTDEGNIINNIDRLVTLIDKPIIENYTDNDKKRTFDIIRVRVYLNNNLSEQLRKEAIVNNKQAITEKVVQRVEEYGKFKKFGLNSNFLSLSKLTYIKRPYSLDFVFELKDELKKLEEVE